MKLRSVTVADAAAIAHLASELGYPADEPAMRARLAAILGAADQFVCVAIADEEVAGWLQAHASHVLESGFRVEIVGLIVGERFRRRGVGRALVAAAETWARERRADAIVVRSNTQRTESHLFYPALGYAVTKTQAVYRKNIRRA